MRAHGQITALCGTLICDQNNERSSYNACLPFKKYFIIVKLAGIWPTSQFCYYRNKIIICTIDACNRPMSVMNAFIVPCSADNTAVKEYLRVNIPRRNNNLLKPFRFIKNSCRLQQLSF